MSQNILFELPSISALTLTGDRSAEFLQGQLTCDVRDLSSSQIRQGALCNLKGRILALLDVIQWNNALHLILPHDLISETQHTLSQAAAFSRVRVEPTTNYRYFGFHYQNQAGKTPFNHPLPMGYLACVQTPTHCIYAISENLFVILVKTELAQELIDCFQENIGQEEPDWHALKLQAHQVEIHAQSRGLFLPHRLGLHLTGHISFQKGCYKGQEIIARLQYRSTIKHTLAVFEYDTKQILIPGEQLLATDTQQPIGEIVDFCSIKNHRFLIAASVLT